MLPARIRIAMNRRANDGKKRLSGDRIAMNTTLWPLLYATGGEPHSLPRDELNRDENDAVMILLPILLAVPRLERMASCIKYSQSL